MASIHLYFAGKQVGDTQKRGKPEMRESHSICTDRRRPGPAAALQVSPTSDTCQSVAILMNRPHWHFLWQWGKIALPPFGGGGGTGVRKIISLVAGSAGLHDSPLSTRSPYSFSGVRHVCHDNDG